MDVIMVGPWMLPSQSGLDHASHHGWAMEALFAERTTADHGPHHGPAQNVIMVGPWMLPSQNVLDHGRRHGRAMECSLLRTD